MLLDLIFTLYHEHDATNLAVAVAVCLTGSYLSVRTLRAHGREHSAQRFYWAALLSVVAGGTVWSTHFIAILGFRPDLATGHDETRIALSLFTSIGAFFLSATMLSTFRFRLAAEASGAVLGIGIAAMHYVGMSGFAIPCGYTTDPVRAVVAIALSCLGGVLALNRSLRARRHGQIQGTLLLVLAIVLLHFTAMSSLDLDVTQVVAIPEHYFSGAGITQPVAMVIGLVLIVGLATLQIEKLSEAEAIVRLQRAATEDPLTGMANRGGFDAMLARIRTPQGAVGPHMLVAIDLDGFKDINDTNGHAAGDEVLRQTAVRIADWLPPGGFAARMGGDEFFAAIPGEHSPESAQAMGNALVRALAEPVLWDGQVVRSRASAGMILCPAQADVAADLFAGVDLALYDGKRKGRNRASLYDPEMAREHRERRQLGDDLISAFEDDGLEVHYQPQFDLSANRITGFEALLRWTHRDHGPIPPDLFVPVAEERGLIGALGGFVLARAVEEAASWTRPCTIAVNVSAAQFGNGMLAQVVGQILVEKGLPPHRLELEITETAVIDDIDLVRRQAVELKQIGVNLAMDDYGTGYSALSTLLALPFDKIKFDKSFILQMETDRRMVAVLRSTVELGRELGIAVLAEGVETQKQLQILADLGCTQIQGFLLGRPLPAAAARRRFGLDLSEADRWDEDLAQEDVARKPVRHSC